MWTVQPSFTANHAPHFAVIHIDIDAIFHTVHLIPVFQQWNRLRVVNSTGIVITTTSSIQMNNTCPPVLVVSGLL
jgi:hypothetical protein